MVLLKLVQIQVSEAEGFLSSLLLGGASTVVMIIITLDCGSDSVTSRCMFTVYS